MADDQTRIREAPGQPTAGHEKAHDPEALVGRVLKDNFLIEGKIGEGGMGVVFRGKQLNLGRPVAVKVIHVASRIPASGVERFFQEARLLSHLHHPNIVQIIDFGSEAGPMHFMVMEYLSGEPLDRFVQARGRLAPELVLDLMEQVCDAMTAAHAAHVIHRDLKPSNLFVTQISGSPRPLVKVLDFGLGKELSQDEGAKGAGITREGVMMGTSGYAAPEQMHGGRVDERADIYSLGAVLYFLVAGRPPYRDEGFRSTLVKQLTNDPDPIEPAEGWPMLPAVEAVIHKAMSVRPDERHATVAELFADLTAALRPGDTVPERRAATRIEHVPGPAGRRHHRAMLLALLLMVALLGGLLWRVLWKPSPPPEPAAYEAGVSSDEVVFGLCAPFSGPTKELGLGIRGGIEARFAAANAEGGVHRRHLRLASRDDGYEPERTKVTMRQLLDEDKVFAFIGNVGSPTGRVSLPIALKEDRLFFAPYTGARFLRLVPPDRHVFNYRAGYDDETDTIVNHLIKQRGVRPEHIAVFAQNDPYGQAGFEGVARALRPYGRKKEDILHATYERNNADVKAAVKRIAAEGDAVKVVVMVATYQPAAEFIQQLRDAGRDPICTNISFVGSEALAEKLSGLGGRYARGVIITQVVPPPDSNSTGVRRFRQDMARHRPTDPKGFLALEGYVAASVLIEGLRRTGRELTTEGLIDALESIKDLDLGIGAPITFGPSMHQATRKVWATELDEKGGYRELELE